MMKIENKQIKSIIVEVMRLLAFSYGGVLFYHVQEKLKINYQKHPQTTLLRSVFLNMRVVKF